MEINIASNVFEVFVFFLVSYKPLTITAIKNIKVYFFLAIILFLEML